MAFTLKRKKKRRKRRKGGGEGGGRGGRGGEMGIGMLIFIQSGHTQSLKSEFTVKSEQQPHDITSPFLKIFPKNSSFHQLYSF